MAQQPSTPGWVRIAGVAGGLAAFAAIEYAAGDGLPAAQRHAAATTALMIALWLTEALPIHLTALVPLFTFPLFAVFVKAPEKPTWLLRKVLPAADGFAYQLVRTVDGFLDANIFLFMGGMCIAAAMERWNLHRRIALTIMRAVGGGSARLVLGFLLATAFISLWISNTATAVMMMPIGMAVIAQAEADERRRLPNFGLAIMLAVAYAANVGGIGTKIGTAPNVIFCKNAAEAGVQVDFVKFLAIGLPFVALFLPVVWLALARVARPDRLAEGRGREAIDRELAKLGPMSGWEKFVAAVFVATAGCWVAGQPLSAYFKLRGPQMDAITGMTAAAILVAGRALDWASIRRIPWGVLLLLGGSFAMADGVGMSGFVDTMSRQLAVVTTWPPLVVFFAVSFATVALSAAASNTATTTLMMTVLRPFGVPVMATSAIAASCDFALPAGTPPNAVIFGSGYVTVPRMIRVGAALDVAAAVVCALWGFAGLRLIAR